MINKDNQNTFKIVWIDVKKVYDSLEHKYLIICLEKISMLNWIIKFLKMYLGNVKLSIRNNGK